MLADSVFSAVPLPMLGAVLALIALVVVLSRIVQKDGTIRAKSDRAPEDDLPWPYERKRVLSEPELQLYRVLVEALPGFLVLAQVQVSRALEIGTTIDRISWLNRIDRLSYDFVICTNDGWPCLAVELDDATHLRPSRQKTDAKKDRATRDAKLDLVRWNVRAMPDVEQVRARIARVSGA